MRLALKAVMQNDGDFVRVIPIQCHFVYNVIKKVVCVCVCVCYVVKRGHDVYQWCPRTP